MSKEKKRRFGDEIEIEKKEKREKKRNRRTVYHLPLEQRKKKKKRKKKYRGLKEKKKKTGKIEKRKKTRKRYTISLGVCCLLTTGNIIHKEYYIYKYTIIIIIYAFVNSREGPVESVRPVYVLYVE